MFKRSYLEAMEAAVTVGQKFFINPWVDMSERSTESFKKKIELMNKAAEIAHSMGLKYGYHNHDFEFTTKTDDGKSVYQLMLEGTDAKRISFEMDMYWVHFAGENPLSWFNKYPGRFKLAHLKDCAKSAKRETTIIGEGSVNFQEIFDNKKNAGLKLWIVELEHYQKSSLEDVGVSLANLKKMRRKK
jgi:sugar phosphate isomerase/epimerase